MKRRQFLLGTLGLAMSSGLSSAFAMAPIEAGSRTKVLAERLLETCTKRDSAAIVGEACLPKLGNPSSVGEAVETLISRLDMTSEDFERKASGELRSEIRAKISDDFSAGRTVLVEGWVLGDTEARLCALAALCSGSGSSLVS